MTLDKIAIDFHLTQDQFLILATHDKKPLFGESENYIPRVAQNNIEGIMLMMIDISNREISVIVNMKETTFEKANKEFRELINQFGI